MAPLREWMKSIHERWTKQDAPSTPQQQRRTILQAVKAWVIDRSVSPFGQVTTSLRGTAKLQLERELVRLPLEEFGLEESCEFATAIRDRLYAPVFKRHAREAERQRVEAEQHHKMDVEASGTRFRADRRKTVLIQLYDNPLLKQPLKRAHIKLRLLGHWGTTSGLNFIYVHQETGS